MAEERVQRKLAAILAADVVGYARLMEADEEATLRILKSCREIIDRLIARHDGRVFSTAGDSVMAEFRSAVEAVRAAMAIQEELKARNAQLSDEGKMMFRIGVNLGDIMVEGENLYGDGINVAARIEGLCAPGEVYVSGSVHGQVEGKLSLGFEDKGEQSVKNISKPVRVYRVHLEADGTAEAPPPLSDRPAVAVLPFENISGDPEQEYFVDGLTEDIITALSLWRSFPVIARNSTFAYKGQSPDIRRVGDELGVRYVVEGSVRRAGSRVRVTAQLIDAETGHHVWAERYDRELEDIFDLQDEITRHIAAVIEPTIERTEQHRVAAKPPKDLAAWEYCLRGYAHIYEATKEGNEKAREMFKSSIEVDPNYSRAHTGLAYTYARDRRFFGAQNKEELARLLFESARRAVALDESDAEARTMLARAYASTQQPDAGIAEARRAVDLNPHNATANNVLGVTLALGAARYEEGIPWFDRALQLNPLDPQYYLIATQLAFAHLGAGQFEKAAEYAHDAIRQQPDFLETRVVLASALGHLDRAEEARTAIEGFRDVAGDFVERHVLFARGLKDCILDGLRKAGLLE